MMNQRLRTTLNLILILIIIAGASILLRQQIHWHNSAAAQDQALQIVQFAPSGESVDSVPHIDTAELEAEAVEPIMKELASLDLAALQAINPEVIGWLYIPGTDISYPLLQGTDNDYYLKHTWEKKWNSGGSIFLDWRCSPLFENFNGILYGHRMNNGTMFSPLREYKNQDFLQEHPYVYVADAACIRRYTVFAAWEPSVSSIIYAVDVDTPKERQEFIDLCLRSSQISIETAPGPDDQLLTLSTCTGNGHDTRWIVQGVLDTVYELSGNES